ncbi:hypothetical protein H0O02_03720 [Candidatus Micrarchaeota archaeon]|nr:hypothetical protein [Candidatus Micrarchaeota archaeon]
MHDYYDFAGVSLRIRHDGDGLFRSIDKEIRYYGAGEAADPDCSAEFHLPDRKPTAAIPKKAIRTNILDGQAVYLHDGQIFLSGRDNEYVICMDFEKKRMTVDYAEDSKALQNVSRWLLKLLIIKTAEEKGMSYVHASAAHYKGKNIVFCGDSHCGKSSSLIRLIRQGARAISDDSVIFDGTHIIPFTLNTTIDGDLEKRFGIKSGSFDIGFYMDHTQRYKNVDILVFLKIWNNDTSEIKPLDGNLALLSLIRSYQKELSFTSCAARDRGGPELSKQIFGRYAALVENAKCFSFYAGFDEEEVIKTLIDFLDRA